jgi:hypothetical protein
MAFGRRTPVTISLLIAIAIGYGLQLLTGGQLTELGANYGPAISASSCRSTARRFPRRSPGIIEGGCNGLIQ